MNIYCLMTSGLPLSDLVKDELFHIARKMCKAEKRELKFCRDDVAGVVTTELEHVSFVGVSGYVFEADIDTVKGKTKVRYIVRDGDLDEEEVKDAKWFGLNSPMKKQNKASKKRNAVPEPSDN